MPLRYYQREAKAAINLAFLESRSNLLHIGTGGGKTSIAADDIASNEERTLFLADSNELCSQPLRTLARWGVIASLDKAENHGQLGARVVVGSAQTLSRKARRERYPRHHFRRIFIDEAHRGIDRDMEICDYFNEAVLCGMTATPFNGKLRDLSAKYEVTSYSMPMIDKKGVHSLIDEGFAPPIRTLMLPIEIDLNDVRSSRAGGEADFNAEDVSTTILPEMNAIADALKPYIQGRQLFICCPLIESSKAMAAVCRAHGMLAQHVDGEMPATQRKEIIERFARRELNVLVSVNALSTGVDVPECDAILPLRATRSPAFYQQFVGRGARPLPGVIDDLTEKDQSLERKVRIMQSAKSDFLVFDVLWQHETLSVMRPGHLLANNELEADMIFEKSKTMRSPEDLAALARQVQAEREQSLRLKLQDAARKAKKIRPEHIAALLDIPELFDYVPTTKFAASPATPGQVGTLERFGLTMKEGFTFGFANKLITTLIGRIDAGLATVKQVKYLHFLGYKGATPASVMSFQEASDAITELKSAQASFIPV